MNNFEINVEKLISKGIITDRQTLLEYAKECIDNDNMYLAKHILQEIKQEEDTEGMAEYWDYDYCMGTLDSPKGIRNEEDLQDYEDELKED